MASPRACPARVCAGAGARSPARCAISRIGGAFRARPSKARRSRSDLIRKYATRGAPALVFDPKRRGIPFATERHLEYYGFELETEREPVDVAPPSEEAARLKREYTTKRDTSRKSRGRGARRRENPPRGSRGPGTPRGRGGRGPGKRRGR